MMHLKGPDGERLCEEPGGQDAQRVGDITCVRCLTSALLVLHRSADGMWLRLEELAREN